MSSLAVLRTPTQFGSPHHSGDTFRFSPSCRSTPPHNHDSAALTPSPARIGLFGTPGRSDEDMSPASIFDSPTLHPRRRSPARGKPQRPQASPTPLFSTINLPLRTPVKDAGRDWHSSKYSPAPPMPVFALPRSPTAGTTGVKRKGVAGAPTPGPKPTSTPLSTTKRDPNAFDQLAPLPRPNFTRNICLDGESSMERHAETMNKLRMCDQDSSDEEDGGGLGGNLFSREFEYTQPKTKDDEVVAAASPSGHVHKRRARSRPVSLELRDASKVPDSPGMPEAVPPLFAIPYPVAVERPRQADRIVSSASLFFGPSIPRPTITHRHSDGPPNDMPPSTPSPSKRSARAMETGDLFSSNSPYTGDSSFSFSISGSPSPRSKILPKKFKPRDSGVVLSGDEDEEDFLSAFDAPRSSTSVSTIQSDILVTPLEPTVSSGWPMDPGFSCASQNVEYFIAKTLAAGSKENAAAKKMPNTPVKRSRVQSLHPRPWASAVAQKTARLSSVKSADMPPRKSMPTAFPHLTLSHRTNSSSGSDYDVDNSPSNSRASAKGTSLSKTKGRTLLSRPLPPALLRRSSSGAISINSDTSVENGPPTPTEYLHSVRSQLPVPRASISFTPAKENTHLPPELAVRPGRPLNKISLPQRISRASSARPSTGRLELLQPGHARYSTADGSAPRKSGLRRFERDFVEVDIIGRGEFGRVMKVRAKLGAPEEYYALKKSKPIEGTRHRQRLLEEVDVLKRLREAAGSNGHANVLGYIDSWEQDDALFIQTQLCGLGNFEHFLVEYGQHFPRLEEARVWKIIVNLSEGLRFIHQQGILHLDLKPANIFINDDGQFKIGDFGMATVWPRPAVGQDASPVSFEREGDKAYIAPEVLQMGVYGPAADVFGLGMTLLETAANIVVPGEGDGWHRLRHEDFQQVEDWDDHCSPQLVGLVKSMMCADPAARVSVTAVWAHPVVRRTRAWMTRAREEALATGAPAFGASPLASVPEGFLELILASGESNGDVPMDLSA